MGAELNRKRDLAIADHFIQARVVENAKDFGVRSGVVINLSNDPLVVADSIPTIVPPWKSTVLRDGTIGQAERAAIIDVPCKTNIGGLVFGGWEWFGNRLAKFPRTTPLYISKYDTVGIAVVDPFVFSNNRSDVRTLGEFSVRVNLWWAPAETDCFIHNEHPFLEIHTQIFGSGRIQMFRERDETTLFREIAMAPGYTHDPFVHVVGQREWAYPWHRYYSDTDAIWLAIEFHPLAG